MSRYRDDGSSWGGALVVLAVIAALGTGYVAYENGLRVYVVLPRAVQK
jgi:hypothetical protein